jgi:hypothetical protein
VTEHTWQVLCTACGWSLPLRTGGFESDDDAARFIVENVKPHIDATDHAVRSILCTFDALGPGSAERSSFLLNAHD